MNDELVKKAVYDLIVALGEDPNREGLIDTPKRVCNMYKEILNYKKFNNTTFENNYDDVVMVKNIEFCSMCEHHLLPFFGVAHIAYIPSSKIIGLSKLARIVEKHSKKLQVQEQMMQDILLELKKVLKTEDIAIYIEAKHMCMVMRGVKKELSSTITVKLNGKFKDEKKMDFYSLIGCNK